MGSWNDTMFTETVGGTAQTWPVYRLTCDDTLAGTTVRLENTATGEVIEWSGDLTPGDVVVIDSQRYLVTKNGAGDMSSVDGSFPRLLPGVNLLSLSGFSGDLQIDYTERYV